MRLTRVRVSKFRCIEDSNEFEVGDVTCLVGKNESGKTALLQALYRINPVVAEHAAFDVVEDFPRAEVDEYMDALEGADPASRPTVVRATFALEPADLVRLNEELGDRVIAVPQVTVACGYDNRRTVSLHVDEQAAVRRLLSGVDLPSHVVDQGQQCRTLAALEAHLDQFARAQAQAHEEALARAAQLPEADVVARARAIDDAKRLAESESSRHLRSRLASMTDVGLEEYIWRTYLVEYLPRFLYFDEYYQLEGQVNVPALRDRAAADRLVDSDRPMLGLLELARLRIEDLVAPRSTVALKSRLEGASNHLSAQVLKYWTQNSHLAIRFDLRQGLADDPPGMREGYNLWGEVFDATHQVTTRLGARSRGFIWFFSFLAWFSQQKARNSRLVLLLDEPGLFLHANGQADLLRYIEEELRPHHQVIYTTHSPSMIHPHRLDRVRIVRDRSMESDVPLPARQRGTKVLADVLEADEDSLSPLHGALTYEVSRSFFAGEHLLIVEGVSDLLYLEGMKDLLRGLGRATLSDQWIITPAGGLDRIPLLVALHGAQRQLNVVTLMDVASDPQRFEGQVLDRLLERKRVVPYARFTGNRESDMEDMFSAEFYLKLVNCEYARTLARPVRLSDLKAHSRVLVRLEPFWAQYPLHDDTFTRYRPARYFIQNLGALTADIVPPVLERFEGAFKLLNSLL